MKNYLLKCKDMYNLYKRIKEIKPSYELFYSVKSHCYEIHDLENKNNSLCLSVKPELFDSRIIKKLFDTRRENMKKLFLLLEEENRKLEEKKMSMLTLKSADIIEEIIGYSERNNKDLSQEDIHNLIDKMEAK